MRDHSGHIELSRDEAVDGLLQASGFCAGGRQVQVERVPLAQAFGRVLACDVAATNDAPNMVTCQMDSVALHWDDFAGLAPGEVPDTASWARGRDWDFANTGVAMPDGFDTALRIEEVEVAPDEQSIRLLGCPVGRGAGTRAVGSSHAAGDVVAHAGAVITPDVAARIAGGNHTVAPCAAKPRVAFIPTGNELVPAGVVPEPDANGRFAAAGKNLETNSVLVRGKVERWGGVYVPFDIVPDEPERIRAALEDACACADIVVLNAGSSKGSDDWSCEVMEQMGRMICHQTTHGPGHHSSAALIAGTPVVGISGPSGGASFTLDFYLKPLVRAFLGLPARERAVFAVLAADFPKRTHGPGQKHHPDGKAPGGSDGKPRLFYSVRPVNVQVGGDGQLVATPVPGRMGSPQTDCANALCLVPGGPDEPHAGDIVQVEWR